MVLYFWLMIHFLIFLISGSTSFFPLRNGDFFPLTTIGGRVEIPFKDKAISNLVCEAISIWHESHPYSIRKKSIVFYTCVIQSFPPPIGCWRCITDSMRLFQLFLLKGFTVNKDLYPYFIAVVVLSWSVFDIYFLLNSEYKKPMRSTPCHSVEYSVTRKLILKETKTVRIWF